MGSHSIPYVGEVDLRYRDYVFIAFTAGFFAFLLFVGVNVGWSGSVLVGIGLCVVLILVVVMNASQRAMQQMAGDYRFDP